MTLEESLEVSRIHSVAGTLPGEGILTSRPFRMPHHTVSASALAGGGVVPHPGEISLAHRGVLYLDELPEFRKRDAGDPSAAAGGRGGTDRKEQWNLHISCGFHACGITESL